MNIFHLKKVNIKSKIGKERNKGAHIIEVMINLFVWTKCHVKYKPTLPKRMTNFPTMYDEYQKRQQLMEKNNQQ